jgi:hypothetical protein
MSTHVEIVVPVVADSLIHNSACTKRHFMTTEQNQQNARTQLQDQKLDIAKVLGLPAGTLATSLPSLKNLV